MSQHYQITGFMSLKEQDIFNDGCQPDTATDGYFDHNLSANSPRELAHLIALHFGVDETALIFNACEETGRLDIQRMENAEGELPTADELDKWKRGECVLWSATYTTTLELYQTAEWPQESKA